MLTDNRITIDKFEQLIWEHKDYFKTIYIDEEDFFVPKDINSNNSNRFYISDNSVFKWCELIADKYIGKENTKEREQLVRDLKEKRGGQYSNGTLFSSSRLIAEIFYKDENRKKLIKLLELDDKYSIDDFQWILEYRLPIFFDNEPHPAQMDLVVENEDVFIGIESKMREIYALNYDNDFKLSYRDGEVDLLKEFEEEFTIENKEDMANICLYRKENDEFFWYSDGRIVTHLLNDQESLKSLLPDTVNKDNIFIVPLNKYYYKCPVCFNRTFQERYCFEICLECGWEDEYPLIGANGRFVPTKEQLEKYPSLYKKYMCYYSVKHKLPNNEPITLDLDNIDQEIRMPMTPEVYREEYLKIKENGSDYSWAKDVGLIDDDKK